MTRLIQRYLIAFENTKHQALASQLEGKGMGEISELRDRITWLEGAFREPGTEGSRRSHDVAQTEAKVIGNK